MDTQKQKERVKGLNPSPQFTNMKNEKEMKLMRKKHTKMKWILGMIIGSIFFISLGMMIALDEKEINEEEYLNEMVVYMSIFQENAQSDSAVILMTAFGQITKDDCSDALIISNVEYEVIKEELEKMEIPVKYTEAHKHIINAASYMEQATWIILQDCESNEKINEASELITMATEELREAEFDN